MQSLFDFIITPKDNRRYNNTKNIEDIEIITSTSQEDHRFANREGIVVNVPKGYSGEIKIQQIYTVSSKTERIR